MNWYYCKSCHGITKRDSNKQKIKSACEMTGKTIFITKVKNGNELAKKLRRYFLKNQFELKSFTKKERMFLEMAFEQGSMVTFNVIR